MTCIKVGDRVVLEDVEACRRDFVLPDFVFAFWRSTSAGRAGSGMCAWLSAQGGDEGCTAAQFVILFPEPPVVPERDFPEPEPEPEPEADPAPECASGEFISRKDTDIERERDESKRDAEVLVLFPVVAVVVVRERRELSLTLDQGIEGDGTGDCMNDGGGRHLRVALSTRTFMRVSQSGEPRQPTMYPLSAFMVLFTPKSAPRPSSFLRVVGYRLRGSNPSPSIRDAFVSAEVEAEGTLGKWMSCARR